MYSSMTFAALKGPFSGFTVNIPVTEAARGSRDTYDTEHGTGRAFD